MFDINIFVQLSKSSRSIHEGAYFSAVSGWKSILISVPGPYKCTECYRLLVFSSPATCFAPNSHSAPAAPWVFQIDLCRNRTHGFVCLTNQWGQLKHKSIWNAHGAAGAMQCDCMGQKKNCWSLMLFSNTLVVAVSVAILGTNRYWTQLFRGKRSFIRSGRKFWVVFRKLMFKWNRGGVISAKCSSLHSIPFHHHHHQWYWQFVIIIKIMIIHHQLEMNPTRVISAKCSTSLY